MRRLWTVSLAFAFSVALFSISGADLTQLPIPEIPSQNQVVSLNAANDFIHGVGMPGHKGWQIDYKRDKPAYLLSGLISPVSLGKGTFRVTYSLRRGTYPKKGLLFKCYSVFRIELWDVTENSLILSRDLQVDDFETPNHYEKRWLEFSTINRESHTFEPRVYWYGLTNGEVEDISFSRFEDVPINPLAEKADHLQLEIENHHLENGFVVSRKIDGTPDEVPDSTTYTGFYTAALAWKYGVTKSPYVGEKLENALMTLHKTVQGTDNETLLSRHVDANGIPHPKQPSKDVYTSFFFAMSVALPQVKNKSLRELLIKDMNTIATKLLRDELVIKSGDKELFTLTPYLTESEIREGIHKLIMDPKKTKSFVKGMIKARQYFPFSELWPGMSKLIKALEKRDENQIFSLVVPTVNGIFQLVHRGRDILREQYREDLFPKRFNNLNYPGKKLEILLSNALEKLPGKKGNKKIERISDFKVLGSNSILALHVIKTAALATHSSTFDEYYKQNLFTQDELLTTALNWYNFEEDFLRLTNGNTTVDEGRRGYLSLLSLFNLEQSEKNPTIKNQYQSLLERAWVSYQNEDNPMVHALLYVTSQGKKGDIGLILRGLQLYPEDRNGFGGNYWKENGEKIAELVGGGVVNHVAREPLPISFRPKDSFLWQRTPRQLRGDNAERVYPATDYLFVYWFCRYYKIIPEPTAIEQVKEDN